MNALQASCKCNQRQDRDDAVSAWSGKRKKSAPDFPEPTCVKPYFPAVGAVDVSFSPLGSAR